ncbi:hypothetical protein P8843_04335 [Bacillus inaquosorum]|uniref:hypothetical protein n=1 Tax=Bacillus inaquosorum TaxID=483913 RepID=UPI00227ED894|nr:hypothetical protein [Bacillus inaquosorum]MCY7975579.1 hypothetical protein [Bacillus inaquosorum]MEC0589464.1 hypothetical protein [Bacillus inaquosorum]
MSDNPNPKFPNVTRPRWEPNDDINNIQGIIDFIKDEYGNYYTPYQTSKKGGKLLEVTLVHVLYDEAFSTVFVDDTQQAYRFSHLGELLLDRMNGHIKELEIEGRRIFTVQDLINNGTEVYFWDISKPKTQNKRQ